MAGYSAGILQLSIFCILALLFHKPSQEYSQMMGWVYLEPAGWSPIAQYSLSFILIILQAFIFDFFISTKNIYEKSTGLPFLLYTLFFSIHPALIKLSPALISLSFILISIWMLINLYQQKKAMFVSFNIGLLTTIATLFWFPAILFHIFNIIACAIIRPVSYKETIAFIIGGLLPLLYLFAFQFAFNFQFDYQPQLIIENPKAAFAQLRFSPAIWTYAGALAVLMNIALFHYFRVYGRLKIISRRFFNVTALIPLFLILGSLLAESPQGSHFAAFAIPFATLLTQLLLDVKDERYIKIGFILFFLIVTWLQIDWYLEISFSILK